MGKYGTPEPVEGVAGRVAPVRQRHRSHHLGTGPADGVEGVEDGSAGCHDILDKQHPVAPADLQSLDAAPRSLVPSAVFER